MVAYGLGSVNDNLTSQYQFACALALRNELGINSSIEIFDPAMGKVLYRVSFLSLGGCGYCV